VSILEVRDLHVSYGQIDALRGVSLDVAPGEIVAILGSNGAGKSTTLRSISGLVRPSRGEIVFNGQSIVHRPAHEIVAMGLGHVPEGRRIFGVLSVEENLTLGAYVIRQRKELVRQRRDRVLRLFPRLAERRHQLAGTLSGGEQQMLAIGRALMSQPRLLALDEPSLGLSPLLARMMLKIVRQIARAGTSVLLVEQNARQALRIANRGYVMETGRIVLQDDAARLAADERVQRAYLGGLEAIGQPD
jgi:branched-chain amino acid transport system ATP-binding protein